MNVNSEFDGECVGIIENNGGENFAIRLRWKNGLFTAIDDVPVASAPADARLMYGLFDPQMNGFAGVDFQQDDLTTEDLLRAVHELRRHACSGILLTLITDEWPRMMKRLAHIKKLRDANAELREAIVGWHIEGPFLSAEDGYRGAHNPALMIDPTLDHIRQLREVAALDPILLTLAPEREGAIQAIEFATQHEIHISAGHTNASERQLRSAAAAGAVGFTHVGNGCPRTLDRQDNILWRALNSGLNLGIIPDAIHVAPDLFRVVHACTQAERRMTGQLYFTTDAMAAAGAPPGTYSIGKVRVDVGADGVVRLPGQPYFAGSALTPLQGLIRGAKMLGLTPLQCADYFSDVTLWTRLLNGGAYQVINKAWTVGEPATFCLLRTDAEQNIASGELYVRGKPTSLKVND